MKKKTKRKTNSSKIQTTKSEISLFTIVLLILSLLLTYVIVLKGLEYNRRIFTWSIISLFFGLLFESLYIFESLNKILNCFSVSYFVSLITFLPWKSEREYNLEKHIELWPYFFLLTFIIGIIIVNQKKVTIKQTEGTTLLQSFALIYWIIDYKYFNNFNFFKTIILILTVAASLFAIINAFTKITLNETNRLLLSIWSSMILMCLAIDNVLRVFRNGDIDQQNTILTSIEVGLQYFFVGVSSVYIIQNILMLFAFFPEKNIKYKQTFYVAKKMHLDRYSDLQVSVWDSLFCICFCLFFFFLNSIFDFLPRHTMIWFVIVIFPIIVHLLNKIRKKTTANTGLA